MTNFENAFVEFMARATVILKNGYASDPDATLDYEPGRKYIRLVSVTHGSKSCFGFVEASTGNVLKADGWKGPAKNFPRGNIFDEKNGVGRVGPYGVH